MFGEPGQQIKEDLSVGAQKINKEMQLFEATKKRPENSEKIYRSLFTIRPTSVEAERAFSAMGLFATTIRSLKIERPVTSCSFIAYLKHD